MLQYLGIVAQTGKYLLRPLFVAASARIEFLFLCKKLFPLDNFLFGDLLLQLVDSSLSPGQIRPAGVVEILSILDGLLKVSLLLLIFRLLFPCFPLTGIDKIPGVSVNFCLSAILLFGKVFNELTLFRKRLLPLLKIILSFGNLFVEVFPSFQTFVFFTNILLYLRKRPALIFHLILRFCDDLRQSCQIFFGQ